MSTPIGKSLSGIREEVASACARAGRDPGQVTLVAVSKHQPKGALQEAMAAGQVDFGESYAQELRNKVEEFQAPQGPVGPQRSSSQAAPRWHFIGPLQRNKVKVVVGVASLIHAVDSERLLVALQDRAGALGITQDLLVQVNLAEEAQKAGAHREDVLPLLRCMASTPNLRCLGLMLMPPWDPDPEATRPLFRALCEMRTELSSLPLANVDLRHLSMGMSHDFGVAIEEGATLVRVGTAIFGER